MAAEGEVQIEPRLGALTEQVASRETGAVSSREDSRHLAPKPQGEPIISQAKTFLSVSNEYWLIGIIIVLITVILMLIVYIVKIKQGAPKPDPHHSPGQQAATDEHSDGESSSDKSPATEPEPHINADQIHHLAQRRFVPHSRGTGVIIEPLSSSTHGEPSGDEEPLKMDDSSQVTSTAAEPEPIFVMQGSASVPPAESASPKTPAEPSHAPTELPRGSNPGVAESIATPSAAASAAVSLSAPMPTVARPTSVPRRKKPAVAPGAVLPTSAPGVPGVSGAIIPPK